MGTADLLFPPGITDIRELPAPVFDAIRMSLIFLGFEELPTEEQPDKSIWLDPEALKAHFDRVKAERKAKADPNAPQPAEGPMKRNPLAQQMIVGK